jgi:predicted Rossmann fold flavoprotein
MARLSGAGIALEEREFGQIFCLQSAGDVLAGLLADLPATCRIARNTAALAVTPPDNRPSAFFSVRAEGAFFTAPKLLAATGSPAWPQCGAGDSGLKLMRALGHKVIPARPVLVPFVLDKASPFADLAGISVTARVRLDADDSPTFTAPLLFTHKGVSGPAALQLSCFWRKGQAIIADFLPAHAMTALLDTATGKATPRSLLAGLLPERLALALLPPALAQRRAAELSRKDRTALGAAVHAQPLIPTRTEGMAHAEAAAGGLDTREFDPRSMQSRIVPGLFCCGEMLDITGRLGGYNLHWAWASGTAAGHGAVS